MRSNRRAFPEGGAPFRIYMKKKKGYLFTDKKNSNRAVMATILGIISLVSLAVVVFFSYRSGGEAKTGYGVTALLAGIYSLTGFVLGLVTIQDKNYFRLFPVLGILLNGAALAGIGLILYMGGNLE